MQIIKKARTDVLLIICSGFFYFLLCSCLYLALNSASSEESFARDVYKRQDMGKVIGKSGRIAKSIRAVVSAAASKSDKKVIVEIDN